MTPKNRTRARGWEVEGVSDETRRRAKALCNLLGVKQGKLIEMAVDIMWADFVTGTNENDFSQKSNAMDRCRSDGADVGDAVSE